MPGLAVKGQHPHISTCSSNSLGYCRGRGEHCAPLVAIHHAAAVIQRQHDFGQRAAAEPARDIHAKRAGILPDRRIQVEPVRRLDGHGSFGGFEVDSQAAGGAADCRITALPQAANHLAGNVRLPTGWAGPKLCDPGSLQRMLQVFQAAAAGPARADAPERARFFDNFHAPC